MLLPKARSGGTAPPACLILSRGGAAAVRPANRAVSNRRDEGPGRRPLRKIPGGLRSRNVRHSRGRRWRPGVRFFRRKAAIPLGLGSYEAPGVGTPSSLVWTKCC
jgi:hypothetical protein